MVVVEVAVTVNPEVFGKVAFKKVAFGKVA